MQNKISFFEDIDSYFMKRADIKSGNMHILYLLWTGDGNQLARVSQPINSVFRKQHQDLAISLSNQDI